MSFVSYDTIVRAINEDPEAINYILNYYASYIAKLSLKQIYSDDGNVYNIVDEYIKRRLETKLITHILNFKVA